MGIGLTNRGKDTLFGVYNISVRRAEIRERERVRKIKTIEKDGV